jgi:arylsulfatase
MHGSSLFPVFREKEREEPSFFISGLERHRMFRMGEWKIARVNGEAWELYNVSRDPSETTNLAETDPARVKQLSKSYEKIWEEMTRGGSYNSGD